MKYVSELHQLIVDAGIPIDGVSETGRIDFKEEATPEQILQAMTLRDNFDPAGAEAREAEIEQAPLTAKQFFAASPAAVAFLRLAPEDQATAVDGMDLAQLRAVIKYLVVAVSALVKKEYL